MFLRCILPSDTRCRRSRTLARPAFRSAHQGTESPPRCPAGSRRPEDTRAHKHYAVHEWLPRNDPQDRWRCSRTCLRAWMDSA